LEARVKDVPRDKEVVVVCRSGNRSQAGRDILVNAGFTQVTSMAGGLKEWAAAKLPTVTGP
jgi:rhodanese-related sulfurtransferase